MVDSVLQKWNEIGQFGEKIFGWFGRHFDGHWSSWQYQSWIISGLNFPFQIFAQFIDGIWCLIQQFAQTIFKNWRIRFANQIQCFVVRFFFRKNEVKCISDVFIPSTLLWREKPSWHTYLWVQTSIRQLCWTIRNWLPWKIRPRCCATENWTPYTFFPVRHLLFSHVVECVSIGSVHCNCKRPINNYLWRKKISYLRGRQYLQIIFVEIRSKQFGIQLCRHNTVWWL